MNQSGLVFSLGKFVYDLFVRPIIPNTCRLVLQNGVPSWREMKILDLKTDFPEYERGISNSIEQYVDKGSSVVIVGGGKGVTTVKAANAVGPEGNVTVFEASDTMVDVVSETVKINAVDDIVTVKHTTVSSVHENSSDNYGRSTATGMEPSQLPECDVLELDCEGAEIEILRGLSSWPELIIVEVHDVYGASESEVRAILSENSYEIIDRDIEADDDGVYVLTAKLR
ncbi:FkbM family methyltransferase [Halodesulfurarchaeum sp. HSR-GB]|uniref:FkbM family methyltransferase n=1 Tax=Halodesulfurarchaeum sp. HSR-GB TaxID=3074077 RepID=UPI00285A926B|nr:FkbM family methyltransferase [Halodesulfurarchaeum sp. HSR-GB]MDR5657394.1 FkbM family methyltransferase [Halodesulfurarchaeum sp. HSR-GB]